MNVRILALLLWAPLAAAAQSFGGLGSEAAPDFAKPERGTTLSFPADHGPHPKYRIEWWYLTATLEGADGTPYGVQWTLFRTARAPGEGAGGWRTPQSWMGHAGLTTPDAHFAAERFARGGTGQAGAEAAPFRAWIDTWAMEGADLSPLAVTAEGAGFTYDLTLEAEGPLVFHGDRGYSTKSPSGQASYYYSQPFYAARGTLTVDGREIAVTGRAWLDREWSSQPLGRTQTGWDWFSLHLDDGHKLMGFRLRDTEGPDFTAGTWIAPDGTTEALPDGAFRVTPLATTRVAGRDVPTEWRVELPSKGVDLTARAENPATWMDLVFPYWEGPIAFEGTHDGRGYLEMTGY
ncbi:MAG: lipocalin-like domain-containing protein [Shimia sp.]